MGTSSNVLPIPSTSMVTNTLTGYNTILPYTTENEINFKSSNKPVVTDIPTLTDMPSLTVNNETDFSSSLTECILPYSPVFSNDTNDIDWFTFIDL